MGDTGVIIFKRDIIEMERAVRNAMSMNTGEKAKNFALNTFTREKREIQLLQFLNTNL